MVAVFSSGLGEGGFAQMEAERLAMQRQSIEGIPSLYSSYQTSAIDTGRGGFQVLEAERLLRQLPQGYAYQAEDDIGTISDAGGIGILGLDIDTNMIIGGAVGLVAGFILGKAIK